MTDILLHKQYVYSCTNSFRTAFFSVALYTKKLFKVMISRTLPAHQRKWGIIPSPKSGGPIPCSPCSDAYSVQHFRYISWSNVIVIVIVKTICNAHKVNK